MILDYALLLLPVSMLYYLPEKEEKKKAQLKLGIQFVDVIATVAANQKARLRDGKCSDGSQ